MKRKLPLLALAAVSILCITVVLYDFNILPHKKYPGRILAFRHTTAPLTWMETVSTVTRIFYKASAGMWPKGPGIKAGTTLPAATRTMGTVFVPMWWLLECGTQAMI